jgi:alkanesulfonate monooxygenase SsuD/methylene tetrahydromethanopterin reductase-like flavin-dependent oxidoreductase (luciferase family)
VVDDPIRVGVVLREQDIAAWSGRLGELATHAVAAGIDHLTVGDHVSFADGHGADGLIQAAALLTAHPGLSVQTGVYLLALRHPAVVARQLSTLALLAPGRFTFGVGVGGDDPRELELCGIDPRERGARTTEALRCVRALLTGEDVCFQGRFFDLRGAIRPAPTPGIPILVGGRSDAALHRAGQLGDGWLALWVSPRRFEEACDRIEVTAEEAGRSGIRWQHALQLWAGFGASRAAARLRLSAAMEAAYAVPFERFERYTPFGPPAAIAEALAPYVAVGCRRFNFVPEGVSLPAAFEATAEVKALLAKDHTAWPGPHA